MIMISSIVILNALDDCGLMYTSGTSLKKLLMDQAAYDYSVWALSDKDGDYNEEFMKRVNRQYKPVCAICKILPICPICSQSKYETLENVCPNKNDKSAEIYIIKNYYYKELHTH